MSGDLRLPRLTIWVFGVFLLLASRPTQVFSADHLDHLEAIKSSDVLRWGADAEGGGPYIYPDPQKPEQLTGFEFDLANALAAKLGVKAKMVQNQWDQLIPALQRGNFDIILNGLEITAENRQRIAMSQPYYVYAQQIVTLAKATGMEKLENLKGHRVGVLSSTVAQRLVTGLGGTDVRIYPGNVESFRDLKADRIDAVVLDLPIAIFYARPDPELQLSGPPFAPGYYGIGVLQEDATLLAALNVAIAQLSEDGTLERIYRKYDLWDDRQKMLSDYKPEQITVRKQISTLREWPKYLPLLLRGAVVTVEISVLAMALAVVTGLLIVLARLYGVAPLRWASRAYV
ncbi:MAG TPA: transporter substrate-binding domain-containing protein, partial [Verrucomicrobiae bacterium]|nr:transporter substrate-binding domain-containing protein [Verrucomicrobiae bacterium]